MFRCLDRLTFNHRLGILRYVASASGTDVVSQVSQIYDLRSGKPLEFGSLEVAERGPAFA